MQQRIKRIFYGQADRKGGGSTKPVGPDRKQMWKFWPIFFNGIRLYDTQNTFYLIVRGLKNAFLMPLTPRYTGIRPFCDRVAAAVRRRWEFL